MSGPRNARTTSKGRTYIHPRTGETAWSVTTLLQGCPKPALVYWSAKVVAEFAVANRTTIDAMLGGVALRVPKDRKKGDGSEIGVVSDPDAVQAAVEYLKSAPWRDRDRKANVGTAVHQEIEAYILGTPRPEVAPELRPYLDAFHRFLTDYQPEFEMSEGTVWNRTESYAGTLDWIARITVRGVPVTILADTKTGKDIYPEVALQLALYRNAEFVLMPDGSEVPMPRVDGAVVLHLCPERPEGYRLIPVQTDEAVFRSALYVREVFRWIDEAQKGVLGLPAAGPDTLAWTFVHAAGDVIEEAA